MGRRVLVKQHSHHQARDQRCQRSFPGFARTDARRHQMAPQRTSHKVGKDVSRPHQQQQIQEQERTRSLFPNLHQKTQRQGNVGERKG